MKQKLKTGGVLLFGLFLAGCSNFTGLRAPLYDGEPISTDEESIAAYQQSREITGEEKDYYIRHPFSEAIYEPSLETTDNEPVLLEEGVYTIGEDLPAGRVSLLGNESVFTSENNEVHVGNLTIRDADDMLYFENLFHSQYGQLVAQVDFIPGHTVEIIGDDPEITVFYDEQFPEDPYVLMDPPELLVNLDRVEVNQPLVQDEENQSVTLTAGIYEIGKHLEAGSYEMKTVSAPHSTELFRFREGEDPSVFELIPTRRQLPVDDEEEAVEPAIEAPVIELAAGDKIYLNLVHSLVLKKVD